MLIPTLDEPTRLLVISVAGWSVLLAAGAAGYGWPTVSPLPWRADLSLVVITLGAPAALAVLREQSTISPGRLLAVVVAWRAHPAVIVAPDEQGPVVRGGVWLNSPATELSSEGPDAVDLPRTTQPTFRDASDASRNRACPMGGGS